MSSSRHARKASRSSSGKRAISSRSDSPIGALQCALPMAGGNLRQLAPDALQCQAPITLGRLDLRRVHGAVAEGAQMLARHAHTGGFIPEADLGFIGQAVFRW